jgi:hypothetical protein
MFLLLCESQFISSVIDGTEDHAIVVEEGDESFDNSLHEQFE